MEEEPITLTNREQKRAIVLNRVLAGEWTQAEAALALGVSVRQVRRLVTGYRAAGPAALLHGNRGRRPGHALPDAVRAQVVALAQERYPGFNDQHLTEKLTTVEQLAVSRSSVRRILRAAGIASPRRRRPPAHRQRRERVSQEGLLLQADGSRHRWLGADQPYLTLIGAIDDATGTVPWALFREQEDAAGYLELLRMVVQTKGIPHALYVDRHGIFERHGTQGRTLAEELAGGPVPTQVARVLGELGITHIAAHSPQAKGRIERLWGTVQDRLGSELRLAGARTLAEANTVLWTFLPQFNARFAVPARQPGSAYRPVPAGFAPDAVFCFKYERVVAADNTIRFGGQRLQLRPGPDRVSYARARVEVQERLDGQLAVYHHGACLTTTVAPVEAPILRARSGTRASAATGGAATQAAARPVPAATSSTRATSGAPPRSPAPRPAADHPWRRYPTRTQSQT